MWDENKKIKDLNIFRCAAIFCDQTAVFQRPIQPSIYDAITLRIRVGNDTISRVVVATDEMTFEMQLEEEETALFQYFTVTIPPMPAEKQFSYYFHLYYEGGELFYTKYGVFNSYHGEGWFWIDKNFFVPQWAMGTVMYQIFPDRFFNGDFSNDVKSREYSYLGNLVEQVTDWNKPPEPEDIHCFYGGDLQGILDKLNYLSDLGVEVLYLNPIFVSPSNHKYDIQDYDHIDPHLGKIVSEEGALLKEGMTNKDASLYISRVTREENLLASDALFAQLTAAAHEKGMRIIIDGVFNHCGAFHKWLNREEIYYTDEGAYLHPDSPYRDYFYWTNNATYEGWWGYENHPKLNPEGCKALEEELFRIGEKWVSAPFHADGWRLDVAADLGKGEAYNHSFWRGFRNAVKNANPNAIILAEHYGDASPWLEGDQWDSIMNYDAFMEPISWFFTGVSKHSTEKNDALYNNADIFWGTMSYQMAKLSPQALNLAMNELSNHDHSRFLTRTNRKTGRLHTHGSAAASEGISKAVMREAVLLQMTWPGSPTIYYGDEVGLCGWTDPDNRRTFPWNASDIELFAFHKSLIKIRKESNTFRYGSFKQLYGFYGILGYGRFDDEDKFVILLNNSDYDKEVSISVWEIGVRQTSEMIQLIATEERGFSTKEKIYDVVNGQLTILLDAKSGLLLKEVPYES